MERYTLQQRIEIVKIHYKNGGNFAETVRKVRSEFGRYEAPSRTAIVKIIQKFERLGQLSDIKNSIRARPARSNENIAAVAQSVADDPDLSLSKRSKHLGISQTSLYRILHKDLCLRAYKVQLTQELSPADHEQRRTFVDWVLQRQSSDTNFFRKLVFSGEAHFDLNGCVSKENCRIWGSELPKAVVEPPPGAQGVTVWCAFWVGGVIGPHFFESVAEGAEAVNGLRYETMLAVFFWPEVDTMNTEGFYFQQDDSACHTNRETISLLHEKFPKRVISQNGDISWPPRSCDLTPLDFFLWGYLKDKVYANAPPTVEALKDNISAVLREIEPRMCENIMENFVKRMTICKRSRGGHLSDIVFLT